MGADPSISTNLGGLSEYLLPNPPPAGGPLRSALESSLRLLDSSPLDVTAPLLAAAYRPIFGPAVFSLHLTGRTGTFKTELATLALQHHGAAFSSACLPGFWSSTANALEERAFLLKDSLFVVDDYAPATSRGGQMELEAKAGRLFRAQGNRSARSRMTATGELRQDHPPRGLILTTGEMLPSGHSILARVLVVEVPSGAIDRQALTRAQADGRAGLYTQALAAFIEAVAADHAGKMAAFRNRSQHFAEGFRTAAGGGGHARAPLIVGELAATLDALFCFAAHCGVTVPPDLFSRCWDALCRVGVAQRGHHRTEDPAHRFLRLLGASSPTSTSTSPAPRGP